MPLLKGKFRPATSLARSHSNAAESVGRVRSNSVSSDHGNSVSVTVLQPSNSSAFKVPSAPIVVGLTSPNKSIHQTLFNPSPRKIPTTPFSPGRRPHSPHFIQPPYPLTDTNELDVVKNVVVVASDTEQSDEQTQQTFEQQVASKQTEKFEEILPDKVQTEQGLAADNAQITEEIIESPSVISYEDAGVRKHKKRKKDRNKLQCDEHGNVVIDKRVMTIGDIINQRTSKSSENPLNKIWSELREKEAREKELLIAKEKTKKDRIQELIQEAQERGDVISEQDLEEDELPPIEVELDENGNIVVNQASLEVKMNSKTDINETIEEDNNELTFGKYEDHKVSMNSYSRRKKAVNAGKWSEQENTRFYTALRKVGTDFDLMTKLLPEYSRDQLKRKFKREEKTRLAKVDMALRYSVKLDERQIKPLEKPKEVDNERSQKVNKQNKKHPDRKNPNKGGVKTKRDKKNISKVFRDVRLRNEMALHSGNSHVLSDSDNDIRTVKRNKVVDSDDESTEPMCIDLIYNDRSLEGKIIL